MILIGNNAAGLLNKKQSLLHCIDKYSPGVLYIQETKCRMKGLVKIDDYIIFEKIRSNGGGGGLLTAVHGNIDPIAIETCENDHEVLVVEGKLGNKVTRFINAYGPQEEEAGGNKEKVKEFYQYLDLVIKEAKFTKRLICLQMDANAKLGDIVIPNDPKQQSKNGAKLLSVIEENNLVVVNALDLCTGTITRSRETINSKEESVIDYFIVCQDFLQMVSKMNIDEKKIDTLTKYTTRNGNQNQNQNQVIIVCCFLK